MVGPTTAVSGYVQMRLRIRYESHGVAAIRAIYRWHPVSEQLSQSVSICHMLNHSQWLASIFCSGRTAWRTASRIPSSTARLELSILNDCQWLSLELRFLHAGFSRGKKGHSTRTQGHNRSPWWNCNEWLLRRLPSPVICSLPSRDLRLSQRALNLLRDAVTEKLLGRSLSRGPFEKINWRRHLKFKNPTFIVRRGQTSKKDTYVS